MRIAIIFPSNDTVHADFASCLARLVAYSSAHYELVIINPKSSLIQKGRYMGVVQAKENHCDKVLFIDSDQTFTFTSLERLVTTNKKIVGAASLTRREPIQYTCKDKKGQVIDFSERKGLHEVHTNGFPLTLIDMEVFTKIERPYFQVSYSNGWISEDEWFCNEARKAGYKIWVDADLKVGHIGCKEYR